MTVQSVNNSNNNAGMYAAGAALVGGGAGAAAGWYSKPFLKDGAPTDSFVKKIGENNLKVIQEIVDKVDNIKDFNELTDFLSNNKTLKTTGQVEQLLDSIEGMEFNEAKQHLKTGLNLGKEIMADNEVSKGLFEAAWDSNKKKFVHDAQQISEKGFNSVKKAAQSIQGKYAAIYGAIGAAALGLTTLLCLGGKKEPQE